MIKAVIFDLDGTLIQTEELKARSYAQATHLLTKRMVSEEDVLDVFGDLVGLSREKVLQGLVKEFQIEFKSSLETEALFEIEQKLIEKRLEIYHEILEDVDMLSEHFCEDTLGLFRKIAEEKHCKVVLATMSHLLEAKKVTSVIGIYDKFDLILTKDDVENGKPNPEIYLKAIEKLQLRSNECLVLEDSVNGIKAAKAAKIPVFAVTNSITRKSVLESNLVQPEFLVDNMKNLSGQVFNFIQSMKDQ
ncbi:HAD family hydrolase [Croceivirga thetidis]|uniref:HAD family phosphatase n=1 Tax=Croceivirga thetidis TaxID=2721623 RepID=A0ABX1GRC4_9FLAO|nr:HAD family phosphatase [Croceivirga thetidis]NKI32497.1 HAD family phosphatase [Croceivirga thetidis]